jgi:hypothetical protein
MVHLSFCKKEEEEIFSRLFGRQIDTFQTYWLLENGWYVIALKGKSFGYLCKKGVTKIHAVHGKIIGVKEAPNGMFLLRLKGDLAILYNARGERQSFYCKDTALFDNGWYVLPDCQTDNTLKLFDADGNFVTANVLDVHMYRNGYYWLKSGTPEKCGLYTSKKKLLFPCAEREDLTVLGNGWFVYKNTLYTASGLPFIEPTLGRVVPHWLLVLAGLTMSKEEKI